MESWHDFFVAQTGAAAALIGLLFVSVSLNLSKILEFKNLPIRALECLTTLLCILITSSWMLIPDQSLFVLGVEIAGTGLLFWLVQITALISTHPSGYETFLRYLFNQLPPLPFIAAGILMILEWPHGVFLLVPGVLISILAAVYGAWVLLVEIQR